MTEGDDTDDPPPMPPLARVAGLLAVAQGLAMLAGLAAVGTLAGPGDGCAFCFGLLCSPFPLIYGLAGLRLAVGGANSTEVVFALAAIFLLFATTATLPLSQSVGPGFMAVIIGVDVSFAVTTLLALTSWPEYAEWWAKARHPE